MDDKQRVAKAKEEAALMLSTGEKLSKRPPFIFRAHQPLNSANKSFQFKHVSEIERVEDQLKKRELFETDQFDKDTLKREDLHRISEKKRWLSPKGFQPTRRNAGYSVPLSTRANVTKTIVEPYEDVKLNPVFVRSTKEYLRQQHLKTVEKEISQRNNMSTFD